MMPLNHLSLLLLTTRIVTTSRQSVRMDRQEVALMLAPSSRTTASRRRDVGRSGSGDRRHGECCYC